MWSGILQNMLLYSLARHAPTDLWLQTVVRIHRATSTTIPTYIGRYIPSARHDPSRAPTNCASLIYTNKNDTTHVFLCDETLALL